MNYKIKYDILSYKWLSLDYLGLGSKLRFLLVITCSTRSSSSVGLPNFLSRHKHSRGVFTTTHYKTTLHDNKIIFPLLLNIFINKTESTDNSVNNNQVLQYKFQVIRIRLITISTIFSSRLIQLSKCK